MVRENLAPDGTEQFVSANDFLAAINEIERLQKAFRCSIEASAQLIDDLQKWSGKTIEFRQSSKLLEAITRYNIKMLELLHQSEEQ